MKEEAPIPINDVTEESFAEAAGDVFVSLAWDWLDSDKNGTVDKKEAKTAFKFLGFKKDFIKEAFKEIDADKNKKID